MLSLPEGGQPEEKSEISLEALWKLLQDSTGTVDESVPKAAVGERKQVTDCDKR